MQREAALLSAIGVHDGEPDGCTKVMTGTIFLVTRYEYANPALQTTDWYNVYQAARSLGVPQADVHVVLLDGHAASPLDAVWERAFASFQRVKSLEDATGMAAVLCAAKVVVVPIGYRSPLSMIVGGSPPCPAQPEVAAFSEALARSLGLPPRAALPGPGPRQGGGSELTPLLDLQALHSSASAPELPLGAAEDHPCTGPVLRVLFIRRVHYKAHPRSQGQIQMRLANEPEILEALVAWATEWNTKAGTSGQRVQIVNGVMSAIPAHLQLAYARAASLTLGAHGAGLAHVIYQAGKSAVLELRPPGYQGRTRFVSFSKWRGLNYQTWDMKSVSPPPSEVVAKVQAQLQACISDSTAA